MKKILSFVLICTTLTFVIGCQQTPEAPHGIAFYYCVTASDYNVGSTSLVAEHRVDVPSDSLLDAMTIYLKGPLSEDLQAPFPSGLSLVGVYQNNKTVYLTFSRELAYLTGLDLTIACACVTLTALDISGADQVEIRTVAGLLDGQRAIIMDKNTLLLLDTVQE